MKKFFKYLIKLAAALSAFAALAALVYYFIKKYIKIEQHVEDPADDTAKADAAEEDKPAVNRKYVNIVLDWDQVKEDAASLVNGAKQAPEKEPGEAASPSEETQPSDHITDDENADVPSDDSDEPENDDQEASADSSIHLTDD